MARRIHPALFVAFILACLGQCIRLFLSIETPPAASWIDCAFWWLAAVTALAGLGGQLPLQNVLAVAGLIALVSTGLDALAAWVISPYGSRRFLDGFARQAHGRAPWSMPALWITVVLTGRGVARLIIRPKPTNRSHGFQVIGLTGLLVVGFALTLEPFAVQAAQWWVWNAAAGTTRWHSMPLVNSIAWFGTTVVILCLATPWLLNKRPVKEPADFHPLAVWIAFQLLLVAGGLLSRSWDEVALGVGMSALVMLLAIHRRGRPSQSSARSQKGG